jgi:hypothetical protein
VKRALLLMVLATLLGCAHTSAAPEGAVVSAQHQRFAILLEELAELIEQAPSPARAAALVEERLRRAEPAEHSLPVALSYLERSATQEWLLALEHAEGKQLACAHARLDAALSKLREQAPAQARDIALLLLDWLEPTHPPRP